MDQVDEVKQATDIVSIIREKIELKKAGKNFKANCPFHSEKTPSFMVSPELQIYKCFGCNASGDVFTFLQEYEGMDFAESLRLLADRAGIKLRSFSPEQMGEKQSVIELNTLASRFYHYLLTNHQVGNPALDYLLKQRKVGQEAIKLFLLGFAPDKKNTLLTFLQKKKNYQPSQIENAGLIVSTRFGQMDRFRGRVIFPIFDHHGSVIALAGRILPKLEGEDYAKYINSPETAAYHKSSSLYGLNVTKGEIKKKSVAIVVEGELDAISLWQVGIKNVVAIKGTALTENQLKLLSRYADEIILALDSDLAGDSASIRGLELASDLALEVKVVRLGKYKDPDEFAKADPEGLKKALSKAVPAWQFVIDTVVARYKIETASGKVKASKTILPVLATLKDSILQAHYVSYFAQKIATPVESVAAQMNKFLQNVGVKGSEPDLVFQPEKKSRRRLLEERVLALSLHLDPEILVDMKVSGLIATPFVQKLLKAYVDYQTKNQKFDLKDFFESVPAELREGLASMVMGEQEEAKENLKKELDGVIIELKMLDLTEKISQKTREISSLEVSREGRKLEKEKKLLHRLIKKKARLRFNLS